MALQAENFGFALGGGVSHDYVNNGFGFNDNLQHKQQQFMEEHHPPLQIVQQRNQDFCFENTSLLPENNNRHQTMVFSHSIAAQMEKQRQELDRFICLQVRNYGIFQIGSIITKLLNSSFLFFFVFYKKKNFISGETE